MCSELIYLIHCNSNVVCMIIILMCVYLSSLRLVFCRRPLHSCCMAAVSPSSLSAILHTHISIAQKGMGVNRSMYSVLHTYVILFTYVQYGTTKQTLWILVYCDTQLRHPNHSVYVHCVCLSVCVCCVCCVSVSYTLYSTLEAN